MIELKNISKIYKSNSEEVKALNDFSHTFKDNGLYFITGKSGSGKTTLLNILGLIDNIDSGSIIIDGKELNKLNSKLVEEIRRNKIGYIYQEYNLISELNVIDNILLPYNLKNEKINEVEVDEVLNRLGIINLKNRKINEISGGQKQRVAVARCLLSHAKYILADEPTGALDDENSNELYKLLKEISKDVTVIVVSHDLDGAKKYADYLLEIKDGKLLEDTKEEIVNDKVYEDNYQNKSAKLSMILKFGLLFSFKKVFSFVLFLILIITSIVMFAVSFSFMSFDRVNVIYDTFKKENSSALYLHQGGLGFVSFSDDNINYIAKNTNDYVYGFKIEDSLFNYVQGDLSKTYSKINSMVQYNEKSKDILQYDIVYGTEPQLDEVLITEYTFNIFKLNNYSGIKNGVEMTIVPNNYEDIIGCTICDKKISGVIKYKKNILNNYHEIKYEDNYEDIVQTSADQMGIINCLFVNENSIKKEKVLVDIYIYDSETDIYGYNNKLYDVSSYKKINIDENDKGDIYLEINYACVCVKRKMYDVYKDELIEQYIESGMSFDEADKKAYDHIISELIEYYKENRNCAIGYQSHRVSKKIAGIVVDENAHENYYVSSDLYQEYLNDYCNNNVGYVYTKNNKNNKKLIDISTDYNLDNQRFYSGNYESEDIFQLQKNINHVKYIYLFFAIAALLIAVIVIIKHVSGVIQQYKKDIGIMKSLGIKDKDVFKIFSIQNIIIAFISILVAIPISILAIKLANKSITSDYFYSIDAIKLDWLNILIIVFICLIIPFVSTLYKLIRISKTKCIDIINK